MRKKEIHVVPKSGHWEITGTANQCGTSGYSTQKEAVDAARECARSEHTELVVHGRDGSIRFKDSYGNDPRDVPG